MSKIVDIFSGMPVVHTEAFTEEELSGLADLAGQGNPLPRHGGGVRNIDLASDEIMHDLVRRYLEIVETVGALSTEMKQIEMLMKIEVENM